VLEVAHVEDLPVEECTGVDDPTSRRDLLVQHRRFLEAYGAMVREGIEVELAPLVTYAGERD
jgi:UDP-N-acetylglucosamine/UDP-N-acetylgalactosamine diphosphorylase